MKFTTMRNVQLFPKKLIVLICLIISATLTVIFYATTVRSFPDAEFSSGNEVVITLAANGLAPVSLDFTGLFTDKTLAEKKIITTMSPTRMNVLYTGIQNPLSVSVSGVKPDKVHLSCIGAIITGDMGNYELFVTPGPESVTVLATSKEDGGGTLYGSVSFRVRSLPKPVLQFGTINTPTATIEQLKAVNGVYASMGDGFVFEGLSYTITAYSFMHVPRQGNPTPVSVKGEFITPQVTKLLEKLATGDQIIVYDAKAKGSSSGEFLLTTSVLLTVR